ncbi:MAG: hypothetical protein ACKVZJ_11775 [Phycisphaerales bacterium]
MNNVFLPPCTRLPAVAFVELGVPSHLRSIPNWLLWRYESRQGRDTKVPYSALTGSICDATNPASWSGYDAAVAAFRSAPGRFSGVGFSLPPDRSMTAIDIDECFGPDGTLAPEALRIVDDFGCYTERTPSGKGLRILALGSKGACSHCRSKSLEGIKEIEVYDTGRYVTVTGEVFEP